MTGKIIIKQERKKKSFPSHINRRRKDKGGGRRGGDLMLNLLGKTLNLPKKKDLSQEEEKGTESSCDLFI